MVLYNTCHFVLPQVGFVQLFSKYLPAKGGKEFQLFNKHYLLIDRDQGVDSSFDTCWLITHKCIPNTTSGIDIGIGKSILKKEYINITLMEFILYYLNLFFRYKNSI